MNGPKTVAALALTGAATDAIKNISKRRLEAPCAPRAVERGEAANLFAPRGSGSEATEI
jgi:hypothetical protein